MKLSRNGSFVMTLKDYIHRRQNQRLIEKINQAYQAQPEAAEQERLRKTKRLHRALVEKW